MDRPKVGVSVVILRDGKILLGKRKGSHGTGTFSFPGGHLEFGEDPVECVKRETLEECGLILNNVKQGPYTNDVFSSEGKHYITLFFVAEAEGEPKVLEPDKTENWSWYDFSDLPKPLFLPIVNLLSSGWKP
jgi:8-oxo-dGTP diphosphatase